MTVRVLFKNKAQEALNSKSQNLVSPSSFNSFKGTPEFANSLLNPTITHQKKRELKEAEKTKQKRSMENDQITPILTQTKRKSLLDWALVNKQQESKHHFHNFRECRKSKFLQQKYGGQELCSLGRSIGQNFHRQRYER
jgi:hypothetical protein